MIGCHLDTVNYFAVP